MKLKNKKTGVIIDSNEWTIQSGYLYITISNDNDSTIFYKYESLAELCEEWEDYKPAESLIKDEKIRKAVRAWLDIQGQSIITISILNTGKDNDGFYNYTIYGYIDYARIENFKAIKNTNLTAIDFKFRSKKKYKFIEHHEYTIAELCGEEEE